MKLTTLIKKNNMRICIFLLIIFSSNYIKAQSPTTIKSLRLNLDNPQGGLASQFIQSVKYIPLETKKGSIFGKIDRMEITDEYFVIQDEDTNSLLFFTRQGKFHVKISGGNRTTNPYNRILRWAVNRFKKQIYFIKSKNDICYIYDFNGKKIADQDISQSGWWTEIEFINADHYISSNGYGSKGDQSKSFVSWIGLDKIGYKSGLAYNEFDILNGDVYGGSSGPFYYQGTGRSNVFYTKSYDYTIYKISDLQISPIYKLIIPSTYATPQDLLTNPNNKNTLVDYFSKNQSKIYEINSCFQINDNLTFRTSNGDRNFKSDFIYNLTSGKLITISRIMPDRTSYYLPIASDYEFSRKGILCSDGNALFTSISASDLFGAVYENKNDKSKFEIIPKSLRTITRENNPIIREMIFQKSF